MVWKIIGIRKDYTSVVSGALERCNTKLPCLVNRLETYKETRAGLLSLLLWAFPHFSLHLLHWLSIPRLLQKRKLQSKIPACLNVLRGL